MKRTKSLDLKVSEFQTLISKKVKKLEDNYNLLHEKVHVVAGAITHLVKRNKVHSKDHKDKSEIDDNVFEKVEEFLSSIKDTLTKVDLSNQSSISEECISKMVSNIKSSI
ncbi:unnamed protein product [Lactuca virosa]|uniref:Uncharacterized protein n=1 Tax=Lactuca virosa TaxID=75947 RepID=A0AAU9M9I8_9ASTR|nr:unnamed protein product [Lactuca virosa]